MTGKVQGGSSSPQNILVRSSSVTLSPLSATQKSAEGIVTSFVDQATEWRSLAAMMVGGLAYRVGKTAVMGANWARQAAPLQHPVSILFGLSTEVTAFELTNRTLNTFVGVRLRRTPLQNVSRLWSWSGAGGLQEGFLTSLVTFSTLKGFGKLGETQNLVLRHGLQDLGMVSGHHLLHRFGLGPKPEGSLAEQLTHAEATNLQMGAGMALGHALSGGRILALEKSLELFPREPIPSTILSTEEFGPSLALSTSANPPRPFYCMMSTGNSETESPPSLEASSIKTKRVTLKQWAEENKIAPDTYLGHRFSKGYRKVAEVEEALEILFGESKTNERPIEEIDWIESYKIKGGYGRIRTYLLHPDRGVRVAALRALSNLKPPMVLPDLSALLEPYLTPHNIFNPEAVAEIEAVLSTLSIYKAPTEILEGKLTPYLRILINHSNREVSTVAEAASILLKIIPVVPDYRMLLRNPLPEVRIQALSILKAVHPFEYEPFLYDRLEDSDSGVKILAAEILTQFGGIKAIRHLAERLQTDRHPEVQYMIARFLGELNSPLALDALLEVLQRPATPSFVREAILTTLGKTKRPENASFFRPYLTHSHLEVAFAAANGLAQLGMLEGIALHFQMTLQSPHDHQRRQALEALLELPKKVGNTLINQIERDPDCLLQMFLTDPSAENRRLAAKLLDRYDSGWDQKFGNIL